MVSRKTKGLIIGLIFGIVIGILPFFVDQVCHLDKSCEPFFLWPVMILSSFGLAAFFLALFLYPIAGAIVGRFIGKKMEKESPETS